MKSETTTQTSGVTMRGEIARELVDVVARAQQLEADVTAMRKHYESPGTREFTAARVLACLMTLMSLNQSLIRLAIAAAVDER